MNIETFVDVMSKAGGLVLALGVLWALMRGWLVPGHVKESLAENTDTRRRLHEIQNRMHAMEYDIAKAAAPKTETVTVPEWGDAKVTVKTLSEEEINQWCQRRDDLLGGRAVYVPPDDDATTVTD